tara:strand:- start:5200 stop:5784 length:585 start_codon:yes stop_codon:yes gene_type:complete
MKIIKVYGELKKKLGQSTFELNVDTPAQAIKALCVNFPDLMNWFIDNDQNGYGYKVKVGKQKIYADNLKPMLQPWSEKDVLEIIPVIAGAGRGFGQILAGALLIGLSFVGTPLLGAALSKSLGYIGTSLVLGGISQLLAPTPASIPEASKLQSFSFSGIVNVADQGLPVPICYGRVFTGSIVVSFGLDTQPATP